jgi:hypothetical protein
MAACQTIKFPVFIDCNGVSPDSQIGISYEPFVDKGEVSISTSNIPATIPLASNLIAGLMTPSQFSSLSKIDISTTIITSSSTTTIVGNNKCGVITVITGSSGKSGNIFTYDINALIPVNSVLTFSDMRDNYAMGHYQVVYIEIDSLKRMVLQAKDGITLEPSTTYKWSYQINS